MQQPILIPSLEQETNFILNNGKNAKMPAVGFGTARLKRDAGMNAILNALRCGYRHLDCAKVYGNEWMVGKAVKIFCDESGGQVSRKDFYISSKLWNDEHRPEHVELACRRTLQELGVEYLDCYLMHWPLSWKKGTIFCPEDVPLIDTWRAMERLVRGGLVRTIGVSNFDQSHFAAILGQSDMVPAVNQIELHPFLQQQELVDYCHSIGVLPIAWSPLAKHGLGLADHPTLRAIADRHEKSVSQVILRWNVQRGVAVIPRSQSKGHIAENLNVLSDDFDITLDEMSLIGELDQGRRLTRDWVGIFASTHPIFRYVGIVLSLLMKMVFGVVLLVYGEVDFRMTQ